MDARALSGVAAVALTACTAPPIPTLAHGERAVVENRVALRARPFPLEDVRLLDGPFRHAQELDRAYLLSLDVDRLLHAFRLNAGLPSSAQPLGGWEAPDCELRGHFVGHYLSACALMAASTGDARLKAKGDAVVAGLSACQARLGSGYLSAYPESFIDRVEKRERVWAPYYTLHKLYAGLLDMYAYGGNRQALDVCRRFADWALARTGRLDDAAMQAMLGCEHGGMNETLANLYGLTGEAKYLQLAQRFSHRAVLDPAARRQDALTGLHANTQIPKFVGAARLHELAGDPAMGEAARFFWETVVRERSYVIGGHSDGEHFTPPAKLSTALGPNTTETCNTHNMLKLTRHLFCWEPRAELADYAERALLNHILASQDPETGMMCYYVPLRSGSRKTYNGPLDGFWCCTGTGVESHAKYGDSIYFHDGADALYVNLFIASELDWKAKGVTIRQETRFPDEPFTTLVFRGGAPVHLRLHLRHPAWADAGFQVRVNGQPQAVESRPGSYAVIARAWEDGDRVEVAMPFSLRTEGFRDNPDRFAFLHGPLVLCAVVDPARPHPAVVPDAGRPTDALRPVPGRPSAFAGPGSVFRVPGEAGGLGVTLQPFFRVHGDRHYVVYWDRFTPDGWTARQAEYKAALDRQRELDARTVDVVHPGEAQDERDHGLQGERTGAGDFGDRKYRHATDGGWFAWDVKVRSGAPQELVVTYWGSDGGDRVFDLLVDGAPLATQRLTAKRPDRFYDETYPLPEALTTGKEKVTLKFQAHPGAWAGGVFGVRVLKAK